MPTAHSNGSFALELLEGLEHQFSRIQESARAVRAHFDQQPIDMQDSTAEGLFQSIDKELELPGFLIGLRKLIETESLGEARAAPVEPVETGNLINLLDEVTGDLTKAAGVIGACMSAERDHQKAGALCVALELVERVQERIKAPAPVC